jgi:hypothetical protein
MLQFALIGVEFPTQILVALVGLAALVYAGRWFRLRSRQSKARNWTRVDATVHNSYQIDENAGATSLGTWMQFWMRFDSLRNDNRDAYVSRWAVAIEYTYRFDGEMHSGTYFLPLTYTDGHVATEAGRAWVGKSIIARSNPHQPEQSIFLVEDGAPGEPHIPVTISDRPHLTTLSLK